MGPGRQLHRHQTTTARATNIGVEAVPAWRSEHEAPIGQQNWSELEPVVGRPFHRSFKHTIYVTSPHGYFVAPFQGRINRPFSCCTP
jgi:hypothetical protein